MFIEKKYIYLILGGVVVAVVIVVYLLFKPEDEEPPPPEEPLKVTLTPVPVVLTEIKDAIEMERPSGFLTNKSVLVTGSITELYLQTDNFPWSICDITNAGPNPVYIGINQWDSPEAPLPAGQSIHIDFKKRGSIKKIYLKCDAGNTTTVNLYPII